MKRKVSKLNIIIIIFLILFFTGLIAIATGKIQLLNYRIGIIDDQYLVYRVMNDRMPNYYGLMNHEGKVLYKAKYQNISLLDHYIVLEDDDEIMVVKREDPREVLIKEKKAKQYLQYSSNFYYQNDQVTIIVTKQGHKLINHMNHEVVDIEIEADRYLDSGSDERIIFINNKSGYKKYGVIDLSGKTIVEPIYNYIYNFTEEGYAFAAIGDKTRIIDTNGNVRKELDYLLRVDAYTQQEIARVYKGEQYGVITIEGELVIDFKYDYIQLQQDYVIVKQDTKYGIYSLAGEQMIEPVYDSISPITINDESFAVVELEGKHGIINMYGENLLPLQYELSPNIYDTIQVIQNKNNDLFKIKQDNKWALFNYEGEQLTDFIYDHIRASVFNDQRLVVMKDLKEGIIDINGGVIIEPKYTYIYGKECSYTHDSIKYYGILNDAGEEVFVSEYPIRYLQEYNLELMIVLKDSKWGVIGLDSKVIIPLEYDGIIYEEGYFWMTKKGRAFRGKVDGDIEEMKSRDLYISWFW